MSGFKTTQLIIAFFIALSIGVNTVSANEQTLEVYETYHIPHKVADVIDSLLKPGETIKVFGNKLIVRASDDTHSKVIKVLNEIDRAPKNFLISIRATDQYEAKKRYTSGQLKVIDDDTVVHINKQSPPGRWRHRL